MMKALWTSLAFIALLATIVPSVLVFFGVIDLGLNKRIMAIGMVLWFIAAPLYMSKKKFQ
jgi:hypothetical protein